MKFKRKRRKKWIAVLIVLLVIVISGYIIFNSAIQPAVFSLAESKLQNIASQAINNAVIDSFGGISYSDLVNIEKDETGKIKSLTANAGKIDVLSSEVAIAVQGKIGKIGEQGIDIPIGTILGGPILTGRGPSINVKVEPVNVVSTEFLTTFENAGINQTRHLIYLAVYVNMKIVIGNTVEKVDYSSKLLIADTVIVGEIPEQYMQFGNSEGMKSLAPMVLMDQYSEENNN